MLTIEIPLPTPSLNVLMRMHHHAKARLRDRYTVLLRAHVTNVNRVKRHQFRHVTITRHGARLLDVDNLVGGCKPLVDALQKAGLLWSDSPQHARIAYEQIQVPARQAKTIVRVCV